MNSPTLRPIFRIRLGNRDANFAPHGTYPVVGEDRWLAVACETDEQWATLAAVVGREDLAELPVEERRARHDDLDRLIGAWAAPLEGEEAEASLQAAGIPAHRVLFAPDVVADPQLAHRHAFVQADHEQWGTVWVEETAIHMSRSVGGVRWAAPTFGEHLFPILTDILGHTADEAAELIASGAFH